MHRILTLALLFLTGDLLAEGSIARFTENRGQWPEQVLYRARVPGGALFVERSAFTLVLSTGGILAHHHHEPDATHEEEPMRTHAYRVHFVEGEAQQAIGNRYQGYYENYFLGNDPDQWGTECKVFGEVLLKNIWPGIDIRINGINGIKYDVVVAPGADPAQVRFRYEGQDDLLVERGELRVVLGNGEVTESRPVAYFSDGLTGGREPLLGTQRCQYTLNGDVVGFQAPDQIPVGRTLVIDPVLSFSSYSGSVGDNFGYTATYDEAGHLYGGGTVFAPGYPTTLGALSTAFQGGQVDIGLSKWTPDGSDLVWSTYLGGARNETPHSLVVNDAEELFVLGASGSSDFPVTAGAFDGSFNGGNPIAENGWEGGVSNYGFGHTSGADIVLAHLNAAATALVGATYVGGSGNDGLNNTLILANNYGDQFRGEIVLDLAGNAVVATSTTSANIPITGNAPQPVYGGVQDAYFFRMDPALTTQLWATYHGGADRESGLGVQVDANGELFFTGGTISGDMPLAGTPYQGSSQGTADGYIARYAPGGALLGATFLGTSGFDQSYLIQLNEALEVFVIGQTTGSYPITPGKYANPGSNLFIHKLSHDLSTSLWSTRIGNGSDTKLSPTAFLVSDCEQIYLSVWGGLTGQLITGMPLTPDAFQGTTDGSDFHLMVLEPEATALNYGTYFGGATSNEHVDGGTSRFDKNGTVYQAVCAGCGSNDDFPTTPGAWSPANGSSNCNLGVFKFSLGQPVANIGIDGPSTICLGDPAQFINTSIGGTNYLWEFDDGSDPSTLDEPEHLFSDPGTYTVTMVLSDPNACITSDTASVTVTVLPPVVAQVDPVAPVCPGTPVSLMASGGTTYLWYPSTGLSDPEAADPTLITNTAGSWNVIVTDICTSDTAEVVIDLFAVLGGTSGDTTICQGASVTISAFGGSSYEWTPPEGLSSTTVGTPTASPDTTSTYSVIITTDEGCSFQDQVTVTVFFELPEPALVDTVICRGDTVQLSTGDGPLYAWDPSPFVAPWDVQQPAFFPLETTLFTVTMSNSCGEVRDSVLIDVRSVDADAWQDTLVCPGVPVPLFATGSDTFSWSPTAGLSDPGSSSPVATPSISTTYRVTVSDSLGCFDQDSVQVLLRPWPFVQAGPDTIIDYGDPVTLTAVGNGALNWSQVEVVHAGDPERPVVSPEQTTTYTVTVLDTAGCKNTDVITIIVNGDLYVPNTFTPNGDGYNDLFGALGKDIAELTLFVFNRWGMLIWSSNELDGRWDGTYKGVPSPVDTYVWKLTAVELSGRKREAVGHVNLVR